MQIKTIIKELKHHLPFTALAVSISILIVLFIQYFLKKRINEEMFHVFHFSHIIVSAMVTSALYFKYKPNFIKSFFVGLSGAIVIGSLSDVVFPYLGSIVLNLDTHFHLPLIEETFNVLFFSSLGSLAGIITKQTKIPHFIHVFLSVFASLFYLLVFSPAFQLVYFIGAFLIVFLAVVIPCCVSDIIFPLTFINKNNHKHV
jgi:hypothetical protein